MSRIGKAPIPVPSGVEVAIAGREVKVRGPRGELCRTLPEGPRVRREDGTLVVERGSDSRRDRALHGLTRTLISNMVTGVTQGYEKRLELTGVGYRATKSGSKLVLTVGFSHPVEVEPPAGIELEAPTVNAVLVRGIDREAVGEVAAGIRQIRPPEPYQGKGIRYQGEHVRRKVGKTGKK